MATVISKQDQLKAAQVVAYILKQAGESKMDRNPIFAVLNTADLQALELSGAPIGGLCSLEESETPLARDVEVMLAGGEYPFWSPFIQAVGSEIEIVREPGDGQLSEFDENLLKQAWTTVNKRRGFEEVMEGLMRSTLPPSATDLSRNEAGRQVSSPPGEARRYTA